jgi:hypothetical protein
MHDAAPAASGEDLPGEVLRKKARQEETSFGITFHVGQPYQFQLFLRRGLKPLYDPEQQFGARRDDLRTPTHETADIGARNAYVGGQLLLAYSRPPHAPHERFSERQLVFSNQLSTSQNRIDLRSTLLRLPSQGYEALQSRAVTHLQPFSM